MDGPVVVDPGISMFNAGGLDAAFGSTPWVGTARAETFGRRTVLLLIPNVGTCHVVGGAIEPGIQTEFA